jgi:hypothetical protein
MANKSGRPHRLILAAGLQSGGSTLVSWCFLQRGDTDGLLDMENSVIHVAFDRVRTPVVWAKMTIGSFRWLDVGAGAGADRA